MKHLIAAVAVLLALGGCQKGGDYTPSKEDSQKISNSVISAAAQAARPTPQVGDKDQANLTYFESRSFDSSLADAMHAGVREITVQASAPFPLSAVPERLDRWLYAVSDSGGKVVAEALPPKNPQVATRSLLPLLFELVLPLIASALETDIHDYAKGYSGKLYFTPEDSLVRKIVFTKTE